MRLSKLLIAVSILLSIPSYSQIILGWNAGYATLHELNREIYIYNEINKSGLKKEMNLVHWNQGPLLGFRSPGDGFYFELLYSRKRAKVGAEFDSAGVSMSRELKVLSNTYNMGIGFSSNGWGVGISFDGGRFKGFGRRGPSADLGRDDWKRLWVLDKTRLVGISIYRLYITETVFVEHTMGMFNLRLYAQPFGMKENMDGLDTWLFGTNLNYGESQKERFCNFGVAVFLNLGKK